MLLNKNLHNHNNIYSKTNVFLIDNYLFYLKKDRN